jgi:GNAT superfamily N-acetyltransferase
MTVDDLWKECFPGCGVHRSNPHVIIRGGHVVSMVNWRRITVCGYKGVYIFGVATHPDHRGQGLASRLITDLLSGLKGFDLAFLIPDDVSIVSYYQRFGFTLRGAMPEIIPGEPGYPAAEENDIKRLARLYDAAFLHRAERSEEDWRMILDEYNVGISEKGYAVWDERGRLEQIEAAHIGGCGHRTADGFSNPCRAMIKLLRPVDLPESPYINLLYN